MKRFCPECGKTSEWEIISRPEEFDIKGEIITVENQVLICPECKAEYEDMNSEVDPYNQAYEEYRRRKGMVYPAQIVAFRKKYDLTQKELSELLGFGGVTLSRYENGALQDEAHDQLLRFIMQPVNLLNTIKQKPNIIVGTKNDHLSEILGKEITTNFLLQDFYKNSTANEFTGNRPFEISKTTNLIRFFTYRIRVFKTKLLKLMFYADFSTFKDIGNSITGLKYAHLPHGPVPDNYNFLLASLQVIDTAITSEFQSYGDLEGEEYISTEPPDYDAFESFELSMIRIIQTKFAKLNCKEIEEYSHKEKGYKETHNGELISYQYAKDLQI
jgi:putative zinc finger/helix-turn-helix YgiT family protein